jgi:hypothetical protein
LREEKLWMAGWDPMDDTTYKIEQRRFLRGRQTLILTGNQLKLEWRRGLSLNEYRFDLRGFLPDPVRIKRIPTARIVGAGILTVVGAVLLAAGMSGKVRVDHIPPFMSSGILLLVFAAMVWFSAARQTVNVVLFQGPGGQFVLWPDRPDKEGFQEFLAVVGDRIRNTQPQEHDLLRLLRRAEIIDDWQFEQAMELLEQKGIAGKPGNPSLEE